MNLLWRAAKESARELGINVPTAITTLLGIGFTVALVSNLRTPAIDSLEEFVVWLIESIAWLASVVVVFVPLLVLNFVKVVQRDRSARASLELAASSSALVDDRIKSFLKNNLADSHYGVAKCYLFGSVVRRDPTRDVDTVIQFDTSKPGQVRTYRDRLRSIEQLFQEHHGLMLHVQTFLSSENEALDRFLVKAGVNECVFDKRCYDGQGLKAGTH